MLSASLYLIVCSARNRLLVRLRRLREPRYLIGGIVGSAYLYFAVFNRGGSGRGGPRGSGRGLAGLAAAWQATGSSLAGLAVFALAATLVWAMAQVVGDRSGPARRAAEEAPELPAVPASR